MWIENRFSYIGLVMPMLVAFLLASFGLCAFSAVPVEQNVLLEMKKAWVGTTIFKSWVKGSDCSKWASVTCDPQGHVTMLDLFFSGLTGPIPPSIGGLKYLQTLEMGFNSINGTIPPSVGNLQSLRYLSLANNNLRGVIPSTIGNLKELKELILSNNALSGSIPSTIENLKNMINLVLSYNQINGNIPSTIGYFKNLQSLSLSNNKLTGGIPSTIGNCKFLLSLDLSNNLLSGKVPSSIESLLKTTLNLNSNYLVGSISTNCSNSRRPNSQCLLSDNCLKNVPKQKSPSKCSAFCGASSSSEPCSGHGTCAFNAQNKAVCTCATGWAPPTCKSKTKP